MCAPLEQIDIDTGTTVAIKRDMPVLTVLWRLALGSFSSQLSSRLRVLGLRGFFHARRARHRFIELLSTRNLVFLESVEDKCGCEACVRCNDAAVRGRTKLLESADASWTNSDELSANGDNNFLFIFSYPRYALRGKF